MAGSSRSPPLPFSAVPPGALAVRIVVIQADWGIGFVTTLAPENNEFYLN